MCHVRLCISLIQIGNWKVKSLVKSMQEQHRQSKLDLKILHFKYYKCYAAAVTQYEDNTCHTMKQKYLNIRAPHDRAFSQ
jgi:hypothetical protein